MRPLSPLLMISLLLLTAWSCSPSAESVEDDDDWFGDQWDADADTDADSDSDTDSDSDADADTDTDTEPDDPPDDDPPDDEPEPDPDGVVEEGEYVGSFWAHFEASEVGVSRSCEGSILIWVDYSSSPPIRGAVDCWFDELFLDNESVAFDLYGYDEDEGDLVGTTVVYLGESVMDGSYFGWGGEGYVVGEVDGWDVYGAGDASFEVNWTGSFEAEPVD